MKIFIAGICGTFMAGIAQLARASGHTVGGCDTGVFPPMSTLLKAENITVSEGYLPEHLTDDPGMVIIGNALSRGNPLVEHVLNNNLSFQSGPEWLRHEVLAQRKVIAVAGTHGKTTTSCILAWILQSSNHLPGFLIGGKPGNFAQSARLGSGEYFVMEADEYDTAFFDKRSKFIHYCPHIAILNNLEFDHADIFDDLEQIRKQFHHLVRIVPGNGYIVINADDPQLTDVIARGCWSTLVRISVDTPDTEWYAVPTSKDYSTFDVLHHGRIATRVNWQCIGSHNMRNALAALAAAELAGVDPAVAGNCLADFVPADRRLQRLYQSDSIHLYDDFAHHPSAIAHTLEAVRAKHPTSRIIAIVELRSNTMKMGSHGNQVMQALAQADCAIVNKSSDSKRYFGSPQNGCEFLLLDEVSDIISAVTLRLGGNDVIVTMSNGSFDGLQGQLAEIFATSKSVATAKPPATS